MMEEDIIFLTANQVIAINVYLIQRYSPNEQIGVKDNHLLESAVNRPKQSVFGKDAYVTVFEKAGALFESLALNHAFHNANKRTALASLIMFLKINQYHWGMNTDDEQDFVVNVVTHKYSFKEMIQIIEKHTIRL